MTGSVPAATVAGGSAAVPFMSVAVCSGPATSELDIADLVSVESNRWSADGEPTVYLAGDVGVALAEVARHWKPGAPAVRLWQVRLRLDRAMDLRRPDGRAAAGVPDDPRWFLDRRRCQELAARFRRAGHDGLIVPSVAFLDDLERWNAVIFVDRVQSLGLALQQPRPVQEVVASP
jgi:RES domain-containing protein